VHGTPDYISPEQAMGKEIDFRSDIYSLGITLFHMVAKKPPFDGTVSTIMRAHIREDLPNLRELNPDVPESLVRVITKMTAKNPEDRYGTFEKLFDEMEGIKLKEKAGKGIDMDRAELVEVIKLEKDKARQRQLELLDLKQQLRRMSLLFWAVASVAGIAVCVCLYLAIKLKT
jgi:serine/threonine-protein kinase